MASFGYYVYLVRVARPYNPGQLYRLNAVGDQSEDLLGIVHDAIDGLGSSYHSQSNTAEGYRIRENELRNRVLWIRVNRGPEGVPGETWDRDANVGVDTNERVALLSGLRAMFALPKDSYYGLLFVEKVSTRHLKDLLVQIATKPAATRLASQVRLEAFAELKDWQRELDSYSALRISESLVVKASGDDASTVEDTVVHVTADGGLVRRATDRVRGIFYERVQRRDERMEILKRSSGLGELRRQAEKDGVTFQDEGEYQAELERLRELKRTDSMEPDLAAIVSEVIPVDRGANTKHKKFEVALGDEHPKRMISIEGDAIPQFKYELGGRLTDAALRRLWVDHAESILTARGVSLPGGWATRPAAKASKKKNKKAKN